ncbi:MAG: helix-turn-helix transcriptional regulator [Candidatus Marinimicrobia bacterium]|nr:helix-turn-helix transcriptional regulator [Candidatus Neomarinimicrobiota bacterium]
MRENKRKRLEQKGWKVSSADDFLGLTPEESAYLDLKLSLSESLRKLRRKQHMTQAQLAKLIHSSQSRIAKMEAGDSTVSLDLIIRSLLALGASNQELAKAISTSK